MKTIKVKVHPDFDDFRPCVAIIGYSFESGQEDSA